MQEERGLIEQALGPLMTRYGYEPTAEGTSAPRELFSRLASRRRTIAWSYRKTSALARAGKIIELRRPVGLKPLPPGPSTAAPAPAQNL